MNSFLMNPRTWLLATVVLGAAALAGCRGVVSEEPPVHLNPNMDSQPRYDPQSESKFFEDHRTMRSPVEGTIARGHLNEDDNLHHGFTTVDLGGGKTARKYIEKIPVPVTDSLLKRGQERYNIYCAPCHDESGSGKGLVAKRAGNSLKPANFHDEYTRTMTDGQVMAAITVGAGTMMPYGPQIPSVEDRWAIVAYVRALEISQTATLNDVPTEKRASLPMETKP